MANSTHVMLKSPSGNMSAYDPDEYDIPAMLKAGWQRSPGVQVAAHMRKPPAVNPPAPRPVADHGDDRGRCTFRRHGEHGRRAERSPIGWSRAVGLASVQWRGPHARTRDAAQ